MDFMTLDIQQLQKKTDEIEMKFLIRHRNRKVNIGLSLQRVNWRIGLFAETK